STASRMPAQVAAVPQAAPAAQQPLANPQSAPGTPGAVPTIRVYVTRVVLDVVVTDGKGNVVSGLTETDFDVSAVHLAKPDITINSTADLDRLAPDAPVNIILLDEFNTLFEDEAFARYSLKKYLGTC